MKHLLYFLVFSTIQIGYAKEWKNLKDYQSETGKIELQASDWLRKDRKNNSLVWQQANLYNLQNNLPLEYQTIKERTDFYLWLFKSLEEKQMEVVWPKMAYFISNKLEITKAFPFNIFTSKDVKLYAVKGSETVFAKAFEKIQLLYFSEKILNATEAFAWDEAIIREEQYVWLQDIYNEIDAKTLKTIDKMAKGKGIYGLLVPKKLAFSGDLSDNENRYHYALNTLRPYCQEEYN